MVKKIYNYIGIGFWTGACVYSLINMAMNLKQVAQNDVLTYNYLITGVAVFGLILNIYLMKKSNGK
jgi:membrane protein DedA with SNARE-associated domain